jgi:hypothetical protein
MVRQEYYYTNPCPSQSGGTYITPEGHGYQILCNQDLLFNDLDPNQGGVVLANSFQACAQACDAWNDAHPSGPGCVAASWAESNPSQNTNCFLKYQLPSSPTPHPGTDSMVLIGSPSRILLSHPTPLMVNAPGGTYDVSGSVSTALPFPLFLYDNQDTLIWVSTTGVSLPSTLPICILIYQ